jgi:hypothetical protein
MIHYEFYQSTGSVAIWWTPTYYFYVSDLFLVGVLLKINLDAYVKQKRPVKSYNRRNGAAQLQWFYSFPIYKVNFTPFNYLLFHFFFYALSFILVFAWSQKT